MHAKKLIRGYANCFSGGPDAFFFGYMGIAAAMVFSNFGGAYGTAKASVGLSSLAVIDSSKMLKGLVPIIMAGILGIYGVIISITLKG